MFTNIRAHNLGPILFISLPTLFVSLISYTPFSNVNVFILFVVSIILPGYTICKISLSPTPSVYSIPIGITALTLYILILSLVIRPLQKPTIYLVLAIYVFLAASAGMINGLSYTTYVRDQISNIRVSLIIIFLFLPIYTTFASKLSYIYDNPYYSLLSILFICVALFVQWNLASKKAEKYLAIISISWSVVLHTNSVTSYIIGYDSLLQLYFVRQIIELGTWTAGFEGAMGNVVNVLIPLATLSSATGVEPVIIWKFLYPLIFAFAGIAVYELSLSVLGNSYRDYADFTPYFFIFYFAIYNHMIDKQAFAILFMVLLVLSLFQEDSEFVSIVVVVGLVLSHYGTPLLLVAVLFTTAFIQIFLKRGFSFHTNRSIMIVPPLLFIIWYFLNVIVNPKGIFEYATLTATDAVLSIADFSFAVSSQTSTVQDETGIMPLILVSSWIFVVLLAGIGGLWGIVSQFGQNDEKVDIVYVSFSAVTGLLIVFSIISPIVYSTNRILWITLPLVSPLSILGLTKSLQIISKKGSARKIEISTGVFVPVILAILFLTSSGAIFFAFGSEVPSYAAGLNPDDAPLFPACETSGAEWASIHSGGQNIGAINPDQTINTHDARLLASYISYNNIDRVDLHTNNIQSELLFITDTPIGRPEDSRINFQSTNLSSALQESEPIYECGRATVFHTAKDDRQFK